MSCPCIVGNICDVKQSLALAQQQITVACSLLIAGKCIAADDVIRNCQTCLFLLQE